MQRKTGPLGGLLAVELGSSPAVAFATSLLADFGARVVRVELADATDRGPAAWREAQARNKESITLDPATPEGLAMTARLVSHCQIVVTDKPESDPLSLHFAAFEHSPLMCRLLPAGMDRPGLWPWSQSAALSAAPSGLMALTGHSGRTPMQPEIPLAEYLAAALAVLKTVAALRKAHGTSAPPQDVQVMLHQAVMRMIEWQLPVATAAGKPELRVGNAFPLNAGIANMHRTKDGKYVAISAANQAVAMKLLHMIGGETLTGNPRYSSVAARAESVHEIYSLLDAWVGAHSLAEVLETAAASDVVIGPIYETSDILANPHITARGNLIEIETRDGQSMTMPQAVPRLSTHPLPQHRAAPAKGADTQALIKEFGLLDATLPDREELSP